MFSIPSQRWQIAAAQPELCPPLIQATNLPPLLTQVLLNRGFTEPEAACLHLDPEQAELPDPLETFTALPTAIAILAEAIAAQESIVICGDYDADGMTSTGLLLRALRKLGAIADSAIPSRMQEGYGINQRIVEECADATEPRVGVILTVDNGIAALEPIQLAADLGLNVIVTDHHDIPDELPPADAILNPKLLPEDSPYRSLAGVGVAYLLAVALAEHLGADLSLTTPLLELCTLGTIADLAPLTGINRRWVKQGLRALPKSNLAGIQALMETAGVLDPRKPLRPDAIGFRLGPRINAVGRIGDPRHVIELLTTDDPTLALEQATHCEETNRRRQQYCETIEAEALEVIASEDLDAQRDRVLVVFKPDWHHGVIGIVASRLVERYGVPVFICTNEGEGEVRGSARSIPEFDIYAALKYCDDLLPKYGGHRAAGGFSCPAENLEAFHDRLREFAHGCLEPQHLKPLVTIDAEARFDQLTAEFYEQIEDLQPWGMGNPNPVFWSSQVRIISQKTVKGNHLKLTLAQDCDGETHEIKAIAWRWGDYHPLPSPVDIAYKLTENHWRGQSTIELEVVGVRATADTVASTVEPTAKVIPLPVVAAPPPPQYTTPEPNPSAVEPGESAELTEVANPSLNPAVAIALDAVAAQEVTTQDLIAQNAIAPPPQSAESVIAPAIANPPNVDLSSVDPPDIEPITAVAPPVVSQPRNKVEFIYRERPYTCCFAQAKTELRIRNAEGRVLAVQKNQRTGLLGERRETAEPVDVTQPHYYSLIKAALAALEAPG